MKCVENEIQKMGFLRGKSFKTLRHHGLTAGGCFIKIEGFTMTKIKPYIINDIHNSVILKIRDENSKKEY